MKSDGGLLKYDFIIIGAGIVGLSTAWQLQRRKERARVLLLEKESEPAQHQSSHNSGVIHAGVYYEPGSLKARFCREGARATYAFCREYGVPFKRPGKLVVATCDAEMGALRELLERCRENGLDPELIDQAGLRDLEPEITGVAAILVRESGITDYSGICRVMLERFRQGGGTVHMDSEVTGITEHSNEIRVRSKSGSFRADKLVVCAGLMADRLARMQGLSREFRIVPYRGEYFRLRPGLENLISHLIYPVPDPTLPFLGVHLTLLVDGRITVGPNAVQGWKREGYGAFNFDLKDAAEMLAYPGFWRASARHFRHGLRETRNSLFKSAYLAAVRKYCPRLEPGDLEPHPAGVRAQAVGRDGKLIHDFLIEQSPHSLHVCNAPSPAATSAIPIGRHICDILLQRQA